jgi:uncharacterized protein (TIGR00299 family) protein
MNTLYIDPIGGIAGDMLCAALLDIGLDAEEWKKELSSLDLHNYEIQVSRCMRTAFSATYLRIVPKKITAKTPHEHGEHTHHHHSEAWGHHHRGLSDICTLITNSTLPQEVQDNSILVFTALGNAEANIHGCTLDEIHFHEVGAIDSILDIVGFCLGIHMLNITEIRSAPPPLSYGHTHGAHGLIPLPAPATMSLLINRAVREGHPNHEQTTPTGAAILHALSTDASFPTSTITSVGYGAGTRNPSEYPNIVRILLSTQQKNSPNSLFSLQTQVDDMTGEALPLLIERCLEAGALDAFAQPILMKKGRMGYLFTALVRQEHKEDVEHAIFSNTSTFGIRYSTVARTELDRKRVPIHTPWGCIHVKVGMKDQELMQASVEYEEAAHAARTHNLPLKKIYETTLNLWKEQ